MSRSEDVTRVGSGVGETGVADAALGRPRGRTTLSARALQRLATGVAKDAARVHSRDVAVSLSDDDGALRVAVSAPVVVASPFSPIPDQSERLRTGIITGLAHLSGRHVNAVDIRFIGIRHHAERRVG